MIPKTARKNEKDEVGIHLDRDLLEKVLDKTRRLFEHEKIYYYTEAVRKALIAFLKTEDHYLE